MPTDILECPICHGKFRHSCAIAMGRSSKGITSERKAASSRENIKRAIEKRWPKKIEEKGE